MEDLLNAMAWVGLAFNDGRAFHANTSVRINFACPRQYVVEMMDRLDKYVYNK